MIGKVKVIPVMDVMNGLVVHAVEGKRDMYRPIEDSVVSPSPDPRDVLWGLHRYGFREVYIADLDAIMGRGDNTWVLDYAIRLGFKVIADIGRGGLEKTDSYSIRYVIGTEYISYPHEVEKLSKRIVSLDCHNLNAKFSDRYVEASLVAELLTRIGVTELIVLDLTRVGSMRGPNIQLIGSIREVYRGKMYVGGGIRGREDVEELKRFDIDGILLATAIHKGIVLNVYL